MTVQTRWCDPYGHATDTGPKHLLGGVYGPEYEGRYKWRCGSRADGMYVFVCANGHRGPAIPLCHAHVREISKRMSGLCPRCAFSPEARAVCDRIEADQRHLAILHNQGLWESGQAIALRRKIEDAGHRMTELNESGRTPRVAGRWESVA